MPDLPPRTTFANNLKEHLQGLLDLLNAQSHGLQLEIAFANLQHYKGGIRIWQTLDAQKLYTPKTVNGYITGEYKIRITTQKGKVQMLPNQILEALKALKGKTEGENAYWFELCQAATVHGATLLLLNEKPITVESLRELLLNPEQALNWKAYLNTSEWLRSWIKNKNEAGPQNNICIKALNL